MFEMTSFEANIADEDEDWSKSWQADDCLGIYLIYLFVFKTKVNDNFFNKSFSFECY